MVVFSATALAAKPAGKGSGPGQRSADPEVPLALDHEEYYFRIPAESDCLGEDDELDWVASGFLAPGESFSFTPAVGSCYAHPAAISVVASWTEGSLELRATVPDADYSSWDEDQYGRNVVAPVFARRAQLCMFPEFSSDGVYYTITVTNRSQHAVSGIRIHGRHENDWSYFYYARCMHADADGDGWNDSLEHTMANLLYPNGYIDGIFQPHILWGSNYLRARSKSTVTNDEIDAYPPDFNDDGRVDEHDLAAMDDAIGQGNGIPMWKIDPNPGSRSYRENTLPWRRYDLDGDGFVADEDRRVLLDAKEFPVPDTEDRIFPTARILRPEAAAVVSRGQLVQIEAHAWDNRALSRVEYLVNGKTVCSNTEPLASSGSSSPFYICWWEVPHKSMTHRIEVLATDFGGRATWSEPIFVVGR
jgi:hypothetical protein